MVEAFNLYEFPEGYDGRKTYVSVRGHVSSVPCCYTYKGMDRRNYVHPDFGGDWSGYENYNSEVSSPVFISDIGEYTSTLDGTRITSRSHHRDHMKRHDVVEIGNERMKAPRPDIAPVGIGREIKNTLDQLRARKG